MHAVRQKFYDSQMLIIVPILACFQRRASYPLLLRSGSRQRGIQRLRFECRQEQPWQAQVRGVRLQSSVPQTYGILLNAPSLILQKNPHDGRELGGVFLPRKVEQAELAVHAWLCGGFAFLRRYTSPVSPPYRRGSSTCASPGPKKLQGPAPSGTSVVRGPVCMGPT